MGTLPQTLPLGGPQRPSQNGHANGLSQDPFRDHLLAVLSLHDPHVPKGAAPPLPRYTGPRDWQTDAILRGVEVLLRAASNSTTGGKEPPTPPAPSAPPTPNAAIGRNGTITGRRPPTPTPTLAGLPRPAADFSSAAAARDFANARDFGFSQSSSRDFAHAKEFANNRPATPGTPGSASSYASALDEFYVAASRRPNRTDDEEGGYDGEERSATQSPREYTTPLAACPACGHVVQTFYASYAESPGVVPTGGALASAASQGGMDALEELRLLKDQVRDVSRVCNAVATGDLTQKITVPVQGDLMVQLKKVINTMVDNLGHFATEVTRVSRDVGTEGKLGAQAHVEDVEGTWRELTDEVNTLAANLTTQVRSIAAVTTAVAKGDLSKQIEVDANGEILDLKNTVNGMVLRLRTLAVEVTRVTLEVGNQGKLGGEATVPDVEGVWFELVTNVRGFFLGGRGADGFFGFLSFFFDSTTQCNA
ncbi:hypothetical protein DFH07DRAFT_509925 [Mycena maculata]|uniref:HAMP domain-containing protein n=1 Tax=Mycena maculata TaxID=230809 RepID=A0AAD7J3E3_9AGAR|nr:hypothetical protein DFH07DRAFT_509925 [Mycena maculata]